VFNRDVAKREKAREVLLMLVSHQKLMKPSERMAFFMGEVTKAMVAKNIVNAVIGFVKVVSFHWFTMAW
jgi:hypothetical protein